MHISCLHQPPLDGVVLDSTMTGTLVSSTVAGAPTRTVRAFGCLVRLYYSLSAYVTAGIRAHGHRQCTANTCNRPRS